MKYINKILLFLIPLVCAAVLVIGYFKLSQKISSISIPNLPSVSFSDLIKFSRFSLEKAPSQSLAGVITSMNGEVMYESRLATESAKITSSVEVQQGESLETGVDGKVILSFKDSVELNISSESSIGIVQTLPADLVFSQSLGTINYQKLSTNPVSIRSFHLLIENNGEVIVSVDKLKPIITVEVASGSATIAYNNINNDTRMLTLGVGKKLFFNDDTRRVVTK